MPSVTKPAPKAKPAVPAILNQTTGAQIPVVPLGDVVLRILALAQALCEKKFYPYQVQFAYRLIESVLLRDGNTITALLARQSGKSEAIAATISALMVMLPVLAKQYLKDWRFNLTDDEGRYRGFKNGVKIGIYAPKLAQSEIMFSRVKMFFETKTSKQILSELNLIVEVANGDTVRLSSGSRLICQTASENAKIEGETHQILVAEEAQDISDKKIKKSLSPMIASTKGTMVMIGTATTKRCTFYETIKHNERMELAGHKRNNFFYPHEICSRYNSLYREYIEGQKAQIGETSDEFQMSYGCKWLFERGMFVTQEQLFNVGIALKSGELFSNLYYNSGDAQAIPQNYSIVAGIDWGRDHDSTVLTLVAVDWFNPVQTLNNNSVHGMEPSELYKRHVILWREWFGDNYETQFEEIKNFLFSWGIRLAKIVTDSNTAGKPIYDRLCSVFEDRNVEVTDFNFSAKVKSDGYKAFYQEICGRRLTFPANPNVRLTNEYRRFINQMLDLRKSYKNGLMSVAHPDEKHAHDDYCFPAYAPVITESGEIPISEIRAGMKVLTSQGFKKVLWAKKTGLKKLHRIGNFIGTANHPVKKDNMYVRLDSLMLDDIVSVCQKEKQLSSTESASTVTRSRKGGSIGSIFGHTLSGSSRLIRSMYTYGGSVTDQFLKDLSFITSTATGVTTEIPTTACCEEEFIRAYTLRSQQELKKPNRISNWLRKQQWLLAGINPPKVGSLLGRDSKNSTKQLSLESLDVQNVERRIAQSAKESLSLAPIAVRHVVGDERTISDFEVSPEALVPVYNLEVEDAHEYVCQGVLVHNCDSTMMAVWGTLLQSQNVEVDFSDSNMFIR